MNISSESKAALRKILKQALSLLNPPLALKIWEWAELRRYLTKSVTAKPGKYRTDFAPYQKEPQEAFLDKEVQTTVLYWAKRLGKTETLMNLEGAVIEQNPRNILVVYPTLEGAKKWSKQFFTPMVRACAALRGKIRDSRTRDSNNTILSKEFPGGTISAIGSNSPSGFRQVQAPVVICDEIDAMENGPEGDPVTLAFGRAENYPDSVQVVSSTATIKSVSRIHAWWLKSDQRKWFVPCGACGKFHVLAWANVKWPKQLDEHIHQDAWYECPECFEHWDDVQRVESVRKGEWRPTAPFRGIRGYWLNGINTTFPAKKGYKTKLHQMASEFYDAYKNGEAALVSWKNTFLCEPHEESAERIEPEPLLERCEKYAPDSLPNAVCLVSAQVDVQGDRLECETVGVGLEDETWGVELKKFSGNPERDEVWQDLIQHLQKVYRREDGTGLPITCLAIDLQFKPQRVRKFVKSCGLPRVYGVYGTPGKQVALVSPKFSKHYKMFAYSINTVGAKDIVFARLKLKDKGARFMHFPIGHGYEIEYFRQLAAEEMRLRYTHGFPERYYEKVRDRNEALDLRVYFLAAMDILKPNIKSIAESLAANPEPPKEYVLKDSTLPVNDPRPKPIPPEIPRQPGRRIQMGGGLMRGFKL